MLSMLDVRTKSSGDTDASLDNLSARLIECENALKSLAQSNDGRIPDEVIFRAGIMIYELRTMVHTIAKD